MGVLLPMRAFSLVACSGEVSLSCASSHFLDGSTTCGARLNLLAAPIHACAAASVVSSPPHSTPALLVRWLRLRATGTCHASPDSTRGTRLHSWRRTRSPWRGDRVAPSARGTWNLHFLHHHARTTASIAVLWTLCPTFPSSFLAGILEPRRSSQELRSATPEGRG
jgi:hypothetical protein